MILQDCWKRHKNLSMAWVDYRKASDMVPHSWIIGTLSKDDDDGGEDVGYKNEFALFQSWSRLFGPAQYVKCRRLFLELNS